jgi:rsbT co-antagonist protein RsbR
MPMTQSEFETNAPDQLVDTILRSLVHPFYIIDVDSYEIVMANPAARAGRDPHARTCHLLTHRNPAPCDSEEHGCPLQEVLRTGEPARMVHTHFDKDGNPRLFEVHGFPVRRNGKIVQMIEYSIDITDAVRAEDESRRAMQALEENNRLKEQLIAGQDRMIQEMSTPILELWEGLLVLPVVGSMDSRRGSEMTESLLKAVEAKRCRAVVIDLTGIELMDTVTADQFIKMIKSVRLLGAKAIVSGISEHVAETLTHLGASLGDAVTVRTLKDALLWYIDGTGETATGDALTGSAADRERHRRA